MYTVTLNEHEGRTEGIKFWWHVLLWQCQYHTYSGGLQRERREAEIVVRQEQFCTYVSVMSRDYIRTEANGERTVELVRALVERS